MFVLTTTSKGTRAWRPIYIGFIKNNIIRRTLCTLVSPLVLIWTISINLIVLTIWLIGSLIKGVWGSVVTPTIGIFSPWGEIWNRPRHKNDELFNQVKAKELERAKLYPSELDAIKGAQEATERLRDLGWENAMYCPKDGSTFEAFEVGCGSIIENVSYYGEWPKGSYNHVDETGDMWTVSPSLIKKP